MSAAVCQKCHFDELHGSLPISTPLSKRRCAGTSPFRFASRSSSPGFFGPNSAPLQDILLQLRALFPDMDGQLVEKVLENCGNNLDDAIKCLNDLRLSSERPGTSSSQVNQASPPPTQQHQQQQQQQEGAATSEGMEWVELFVREMLSATDLQDARIRATRALESFETAISARNTPAVEAIQKENETLKGQLQVLVKDIGIFKRAVAIQHERHTLETEERLKEVKQLNERHTLETEERLKEVKQLKDIVAQYQEQVKTLELNNYALTMHLRRAQENTSIPGRFHPDVF